MAPEENFGEKRERLATGPRLRTLDSIFSDLDVSDVSGTRRRLRSLTMLLTDATLEGDEFALDAAVAGLQRLYGKRSFEWNEDPSSALVLGRIEQLAEQALLSLERIPSLLTLADIERGGHAHEFLKAVESEPGLSNDAVGDALRTTADTVSRTGRYLLHRGLVRKRKVGRRNAWDVTPRGTQVIQMLGSGPQARPRREHRQLAR